MARNLTEIRAHYGALAERIGDQGGGDMTLNDIAYLIHLLDRQQEVLEAVDRLLSDVMTIENLHVYEPVAARVTAALNEPIEAHNHAHPGPKGQPVIHWHAWGLTPHNHMLRAVCGEPECREFPTHNIHPKPERAGQSGGKMIEADPDRACLHPDFVATVEVGRILPDGADESDMTIPPIKYVAQVRVHCVACNEPFRWIGLEAGDMPDRPMVSVDDLELRAPLRPASSDPDFGLSGVGFSVRMRRPGHQVGRRDSPPHPYDEGDHGIRRSLP